MHKIRLAAISCNVRQGKTLIYSQKLGQPLTKGRKLVIQPRILKGFRDQLPEVALKRFRMLRQISDCFLDFGYSPIETPALEYSEILLGKGSDETDKQMYRFADNGKRDVSLRFDLTVPLARFAAMHINQLGTPFRRFHIAPVWRAEKPQKGRFREFTQCDFDILGPTSASADAEIVEMIHRIFSTLAVEHKIRVNHRSLLNGFLESLGSDIAPQSILRVIDKLDKLGQETVQQELSELGLAAESIELIFKFLGISKSGESAAKLLEMAKELVSGSELAMSGVERLDEIQKILAGILPDSAWALDFSIARGLDYYTGVVFETQAVKAPEIGSICSGGRYDDLTTLYSKKAVPGVGGSVGLDRTLTVLEELGLLGNDTGATEAIIFRLDESTAAESAALAHILRSAGVRTELYPQVSKIGAQFKYAERKGIRYAVIAGTEELGQKVAALKDIQSGVQQDAVPFSSLAELIQKESAKG